MYTDFILCNRTVTYVYVYLSPAVSIDVADVDAMISAGDYLKQFVCVVGEFAAADYVVPDSISIDPSPTLLAAGFRKCNQM